MNELKSLVNQRTCQDESDLDWVANLATSWDNNWIENNRVQQDTTEILFLPLDD